MRIQARKCPFTGKVFEESRIDEYVLHLLDTRKDLKRKRHLSNVKNTFEDWLKAEKLKITHPNQIPEWFLENQKQIMDAHNAGCRPKKYSGFDRDKFFTSDTFTKVEWEKEVVFSDLVSNSHSCPDNGEMNFGGDGVGIPKGYPGWSGYVQGSLSRDMKHRGSYPYSAALNLVGINTGTGGGGNENWGYDFRIFLADWPGLKEEVRRLEEERIIRKLKGK